MRIRERLLAIPLLLAASAATARVCAVSATVLVTPT